jgi:hypothetical protein
MVTIILCTMWFAWMKTLTDSPTASFDPIAADISCSHSKWHIFQCSSCSLCRLLNISRSLLFVELVCEEHGLRCLWTVRLRSPVQRDKRSLCVSGLKLNRVSLRMDPRPLWTGDSHSSMNCVACTSRRTNCLFRIYGNAASLQSCLFTEQIAGKKSRDRQHR